jgi:hypothetical protein
VQGRFGQGHQGELLTRFSHIRPFVLTLVVVLALTGTAAIPIAGGSSGTAHAAKCNKKPKRKCKKKKKVTTPVLPGKPPGPSTYFNLYPSSFDFGTVSGPTGVSATHTFVVLSVGATTMGPITVTKAGPNVSNFTIVEDQCTGAVLSYVAPVCAVGVKCVTSGFGNENRTATLTVTGTPGGTAEASLTCFQNNPSPG